MDGSAVGTRYWHRTGDGRVQCDVCPRACSLHEGQRGFCFVRSARTDRRADDLRPLQRLLHRPDREEAAEPLPARHARALVRHGRLQPGLQVLPELGHQQVAEIDTLADSASPAAIAAARPQLGCRSVAFTYNDPVIFLEYAIDVAEACREAGVKTVAVTAGEICEEPRAEFYAHMDAANVDLKGFTERFYHDICAGHLHPVLDTLVYLRHHTTSGSRSRPC